MNIIGLTYYPRKDLARAGRVFAYRKPQWQVRYCVPAHPLDPPIACDGHILEVWTPKRAAPGDIVNPRELIDYPRSTI